MDEEEKTAEETAAAAETAAAEAKKAEETAAAEATGEVDYEKRYKDLQAESTRTTQQNAELNRRLEQIETERQQAEEPDEDLELGEEGFVDQKTVAKMIKDAVSQAVGQVRTQSANTYFRKTYPELVEYENAIAGIMRSPKKPPKDGVTPEERIDAAVKEFKALTEEQVTKAKEQAEAEAKAKEDAKRKASGLGPSSPTPPKSDEEGKSDAEELADRKTRQAKKRGLV